MLSKIILFSIKNKLIVGLFTIVLIAYGAYQVTKLPIDAVPDITNNQVQVITVAPALGATDIERLITFPIEQANSNISGIKEIRSFSRFGLSLVTIVFTDETNVYWARQQVTERLQVAQSQIPKGIGTPELGPISTGLGEIYQYVIKPKIGYEHRFDATELRTIQDWIVRRQLLGVKGVAEVSSFGGKLKQYTVAVYPNRLNAYNITINDVFLALENNNQNTGGAYIEKGPTVLFIRSEGLIGSAENIQNIAIKNTSVGTPIYIRDVADVKLGFATRYGAMCYDDKGEVSGAIVMMLKGANSSEVIKNVKAKVEQIKSTLPEGVEIVPFLDRTKMVNNAISTVEKNLMEGALIVVFVLVLFLGNLRAGLLVASVIPLSMLFAVIMMNTFGVSGNLMSLGALDFGLIVDGAVIIVEAVMHRLTHTKHFHGLQKLSQDQMDSEVNFSASKMMNSAVFGQIIILIVYLPILTLEGIEGKMFKPMAQTVAFALLGAFILSLTYIPMMSALVLSKKIKAEKTWSDRMMQHAERLYQGMLSATLTFPKTVIAIVVALFFFSLFILSRLGGEFIPSLEEGDFAVDTRVLTGSSLTTTIEYTQKAAHILKSRFPEVKQVVTKIGSGEVPTDPMPMEASDVMVILKDKKEWTTAKTFDDLADTMSAALKDVPGITASFQYPVQMRFNELMTGARQDVVCKIFGENLDSLAVNAEKLGKIVTSVSGAENLYVESITGMPQIIIRYNRPLIAQYNLSIADVNRVVNTAFAGQSAGLVFEDEKRFDLVVRLAATEKKNLEDVRNLLIPTPSGIQIPLYQVAEVAIKDGPHQIQREDAKRRVIVGFNVKDRDVESIVNELQQKVQSQLKLPPGYYVTYGGSFENLNQAKQRLLIAVPVSLLLIFILLYFTFNSVKQGLLIFTAIPLSAVGGIIFLALRGMPFSVSAGVGFIALFGIAVLNGIVLIAEFNQLKNSGMTDLRRIVLMGTKIRLRPVLMTAVVASLGFLPMAISNGAGAEVQRPLATVVIGGLMIATILTLGVLPVLYVMFEGFEWNGWKWKKATVIILLLGSGTALQAQQISLVNAIDSAVKNNLQLKTERQKAAWSGALIQTAKAIPSTNFVTEAGQVNSSYFDFKIGVTQAFSSPIVYAKQKELLNEEWKAAVMNVSVKQNDLRKGVTDAYYTLQYLYQKRGLLNNIDSLYNKAIAKSMLRLQKGESNALEKALFETQKAMIEVQAAQVVQDIIQYGQYFHLLLGTVIQYVPVLDYDVPEIHLIEASMIENHPLLLSSAQQARIAAANTKLERARLQPDFLIGYFNNSFQGPIGDRNYHLGNRFHAAQLGIGIPIFTAAQKAKIKASKLQEAVANHVVVSERSMLQNKLQTLNLQYAESRKNVTKYKEQYLKNAQLIKETAEKQFLSGEISFIEYVTIINQSVNVQSGYLDALHSFHRLITELQYFNIKN